MADEVIDPGVKWLLDQVPKASLPEVLQIPEPETGKLKNIALIFQGELWLVFFNNLSYFLTSRREKITFSTKI